ncbi:unnamed protein product [Acanthoscelides obtectus]|uniref:Cytochrome b5 reductase 4 n=1 Tax=Acanthoscelides obtectus TaxID=200917 RepID=A0A9P0KGM3_ACAOB|nr:unnamed protein product [Acanthoscelides obtectus]CAK1679955.1 Cytochrome b5 reductase 4 [Acanthoscelides obtectus]
MDWIRLGNSGKDLTGVGDRAGRMTVTKAELARHNTIDDVWISVRGRVYNITAYIPFHPGGPEELMKGAGIDATKLFEQVHPWVNYDQILQKCYIGRLVAVDPTTDTVALLFGEQDNARKPTNITRLKEPRENSIEKPGCPKNKENNGKSKSDSWKESSSNGLNRSFFKEEEGQSPPSKVDPAGHGSTSSSTTDLTETSQLGAAGATSVEEDIREGSTSFPRFDWIQRLGHITLIFYTKALANPLVEICPEKERDRSLSILIRYDDTTFKNDVTFFDEVTWPGVPKVTYETGKVELVFRKKTERIWEQYGQLRQSICEEESQGEKYMFMFKDKPTKVNHNMYLLRLESTDGRRIITPIGKHVRLFANLHGVECSRSYTPVPQTIYTRCLSTNVATTDTMCFAIKCYPTGNMSDHLTDRDKGDIVYLTRPFGDFDLSRLDTRDGFVMLAAGTGITPMLGLIVFLMERRVRKCQYVRLIFFNKTQQDKVFEDQLNNLRQYDTRLHVTHVLSEPGDGWTGLAGHVNKEMVASIVDEHIKDTGYTIADVFFFVCGPNQFNSLAVDEIGQLGVTTDQMHVFQG